jgi:hypothetical protein
LWLTVNRCSGCDPSSPQEKPSIDSDDQPSYSATKSYIEQPDTYEKIAIGEGTSDSQAAIERNSKKIKEEIKGTDEKLDG